MTTVVAITDRRGLRHDDGRGMPSPLRYPATAHPGAGSKPARIIVQAGARIHAGPRRLVISKNLRFLYPYLLTIFVSYD